MNNDTLTLDTIAAPVGYVYILGPRGLDLPILQIGKTKNDPLAPSRSGVFSARRPAERAQAVPAGMRAQLSISENSA
jgi:hypothetical protein